MHRTLSAFLAPFLAPLAVVVAVGGATAVRAAPLSSALGGYAFPNPGTGGSPNFDQEFDEFAATLGAKPLFWDTYGDNGNGLSNMAGSQYWFTNPLKNDPRFVSGKITPVIGLAMAAGEDTGNAAAIVNRFTDIAAGKYDAQWKGIVDVWNGANFPKIIVRVGYEMNGHWMAWAVPGGNKVAAWNAAFRHVATVMRAEGKAVGTKVVIEWNPAVTIWEADDTPSMYPGDDVVDIMSLDIYSSVAWASDLTNYDASGNAIGTAANLKAWAASADNRRHFWLYPDATQWDHTGAGNPGWGLAKHLAFAQAHKKPVALSETGVGTYPSAPDDGVIDEAEFPQFLYRELKAYPYGLDHVMVWSVDESDYKGNFLSDGQYKFPLAKAAWKAFFGGSTSGGGTGGIGSGGGGGKVNVVTVNKPNPLTVGLQTITGTETDPTQPVFLDWVTYGAPVPSDGGWAQATVDATGHFSAQVMIDHAGTPSRMFDYSGSTAVVAAWSATPTSGGGSGGGKINNVVTVDKPSPLTAGVRTITGTETDPTQPVFLDWRTWGTPVRGDGDWVQATVDASGHFSAQVTIDNPGTPSTLFDYSGSTPIAPAWSATPTH